MPELMGVYRNRERRRRLADPAYDAMQLDQTRTFRVRTRPVALARRLQSVVQSVARQRDAEIVLHVPPSLRVYVDVDALDRIAANVILNALHYGEPPVTVSAGVRHGVVLVTFEDCGRGVAKEFEQHLFKRGARSETSRHEAAGSGVGLTLSRFYARILGGDLVYHGRAGEGARLTLLLPLRRPSTNRDRPRASDQSSAPPVPLANARPSACESLTVGAVGRQLALQASRE